MKEPGGSSEVELTVRVCLAKVRDHDERERIGGGGRLDLVTLQLDVIILIASG